MVVARPDHVSPARRNFLLVFAAAMLATPSATEANDFADTCRQFAAARVVFIGRVTSAPVRRHVPTQVQIEEMRRKWSEADTDMAKRKIWPIPTDLVVTPMHVETAFRSVENADIHVKTERPDELQVGKSYLVYGYHETGAVFPDILTVTRLVAQPDPDDEELRFLNLASTGTVTASVHGSLMLDKDQKQVPLAGVPIRFTVGDQQLEAITNKAGRFVAAGIPPGVIKVEPLLPAGLSFEARPPYVIAMPDGGCSELRLTPRISHRGVVEQIPETE
jgi:hypothetical protein